MENKINQILNEYDFTDSSEQIKLGELVLQLIGIKRIDFNQIEY